MRHENGFEDTFRLAFRYRFEAAHRFTQSCADSCATPHGHTWQAQAIFASPSLMLGLDDMVMEFSQLKRAWKTFITETVDHSFLHHHKDPLLPALREHIPGFRGLPFPGDPTTELIAALFFAKLTTMHGALRTSSHHPHHHHRHHHPGSWPEPVSVVIRETPTNQVTFRGDTTQAMALLTRIDEEYNGWWRDPDPGARSLQPIAKTHQLK